jgi:hypothetical protein
MTDREFRVFLSAVSSEFRSARNELTDDFGARDVLVRVQEQFLPGRRPNTLLAALDDYISGCTTAICVIGKRSGACPTPEEAAIRYYAGLLAASGQSGRRSQPRSQRCTARRDSNRHDTALPDRSRTVARCAPIFEIYPARRFPL